MLERRLPVLRLEKGDLKLSLKSGDGARVQGEGGIEVGDGLFDGFCISQGFGRFTQLDQS